MGADMDEKLNEIARRHELVTARMEQPETYADPTLYAELAREQKELAPLAEAWAALGAQRGALAEAKQILERESDPELCELAREEINAAQETIPALEEELRLLLLPSDPDDGRSVIVEIRAGVGGEESALFAADLYRMYTLYAESRRWTVELVSVSETDLGGFREISFMVDAPGAYSRLKFESGVHRVQRVPETEVQGRVHTSTATVAVLPKLSEQEFELNMDDVRIDVFRSSGAGGQKVNKTSSAIRVTHIPTNTVVECQDERSQYKNKARALDVLASRLAAAEREKREAALGAERRSQIGTGMRNERIRTYSFPQNRVTDHRIGLTLYRLDAVIDGQLDLLIDPLIAAERAEKLKNGEGL